MKTRELGFVWSVSFVYYKHLGVKTDLFCDLKTQIYMQNLVVVGNDVTERLCLDLCRVVLTVGLLLLQRFRVSLLLSTRLVISQ